MAFWKTLGLTLVTAAIITGCGSSGESTASTGGDTKAAGGAPAKKSEYKITLIGKSSTNPVFLSARTGAEAAAQEIGKAKGVKITIDWRTPTTEDGQVQAQRLQQAVNEGADAVIISCSDATKLTGTINDAVAKGIPVMTFDSDAPDSKRFAFYGADDLECGKQVVDELAKVTGGKGNVAILAGNKQAPNLQKRVKGAQDAIKAYPNMKLVDVFYHPETPQDASSAVTQAMNANPQIDSWAMIGGWPLFAKSLLSLDASKVKIVAVDALPPELAYVEKGIAPVLLAQPTYEWGHTCVGIVMDKLLDGKTSDTYHKMELIRVDKPGLAQWAQQLVKWGFDKKDIDPKLLEAK